MPHGNVQPFPLREINNTKIGLLRRNFLYIHYIHFGRSPSVI